MYASNSPLYVVKDSWGKRIVYNPEDSITYNLNRADHDSVAIAEGLVAYLQKAMNSPAGATAYKATHTEYCASSISFWQYSVGAKNIEWWNSAEYPIVRE